MGGGRERGEERLGRYREKNIDRLLPIHVDQTHSPSVYCLML